MTRRQRKLSKKSDEDYAPQNGNCPVPGKYAVISNASLSFGGAIRSAEESSKGTLIRVSSTACILGSDSLRKANRGPSHRVDHRVTGNKLDLGQYIVYFRIEDHSPIVSLFLLP